MLSIVYQKIRNLGWLFFVTVLLPTFLSVIYFGFISSDVYVSESKFVVRSPDKPASSGLGLVLKSVGFSNAGEELSVARNYVLSRDALRAVDLKSAYRTAYTAPHISIFNRFDPTGFYGSFEDLYRYYREHVLIETDTATSISTLRVRAYSPQYAARVNEQLLEMAERIVNSMNQRGQQDLIRFAQIEVDENKASAARSSLALAAFRKRQGVVDPEKQAAAQLQMISKLQDEVIATETQLAQLRAYTPRNPQVPVLQTRVSSLKEQIDEQLGKVVGNQKSLTGSAVEYQRLLLENQIAEKQLASALNSLEEARNEARRKQAYVERISQPNEPDAPVEPKRLEGIFATLVLGLIVWGILSMLIAGIREHEA